ncbi:flippase-like domain-containing protein [Streptomyces sp. NBC_00249]|uniref:lysylphosphatidylglycerol synthase transmembrane domain-containing protein n=1 Tax=Streptomyces sp. NBC_00249 TaxID=2975690 RepID=UPI002253B8E8|nr:lysylphosphatidylglycerol synthase transmembrane domain-containing protein [Streptomyces sp. NBC_00249]MCX5192495.1 flippase-like domain-containing protein [Streptomyces sp. NBC_00249]
MPQPSAAQPPRSAAVRPDELVLPVRARRPEALVRVLLGAALMAVVSLLAGTAHATMDGLDSDMAHGGDSVPPLLLAAARHAAALAPALLLAAFTAHALLRRRIRRIAAGAVAAVLAHGAGELMLLLVPQRPALPFVTAVFAFVTATGLARRPRWRAAAAAALAVYPFLALTSGDTRVLDLALAVLTGWTLGHGTRYALGSPTGRTTGQDLFDSLARSGLAPARAHRAAGGPAHDTRRRYLVGQHDGRPDLDVVVVDVQDRASGFVHQVWQRVRIRTAPRTRGLQPLRALLEREALLAYAARAAGVRTRSILATADLGPDAALTVYEHLDGRGLDELADDELTDGLLRAVWTQTALLHRRQIAHRALVAESLLVDGRGRVHLVGLEGGEIAAGELLLRIDIAQLLTTTALRVGPHRAVAAAAEVIGADRTATALPLLQPLALSRRTRAALKGLRKRPRPADTTPARRPVPDLLAQLREEILRTRPQAEAEPEKLERVRPRTLITLLGGAAAGYAFLLQLSSDDGNPLAVVAQARPGWVALGALASAASYLAATVGFAGFVPERLRLGRAGLAQVAGSFVNLVSPSGLGGLALNVRFLQCAGIPTPLALSSIGVTQAAGLILHTLLVVLFTWLASSTYDSPLPSGATLTSCFLVLAVLVAAVLALPVARRWLAVRLRPLLSDVLPRLLDLLRDPLKLTAGVVGQLLISLMSVACLYCCALAFGQHPDFAAVAVANLVGVAVGSAVPTPGGVGGVEAALAFALEKITGMPEGSAIAPVLLFRLLTFWLPVLPGWLAFVWLQRNKAI